MHTPFTSTQTIDPQLLDQYFSLRQKGGLTQFPKHDFVAIIRHFHLREEYQDALTAVEDGLQIFLFDFDMLVAKADLLIELKKGDEAMEVISILEQTKADSLETAELRVRALFQLEQYDLARVLLDELKDIAPKSRLPQLLNLEAWMLNKTGHKEDAYQSYKQVLELDPKNQEALQKIWLLSESTRNQKDSLKFHQKLIDRDPYNGLAWFNAGQALYYLLKYEEALEAFEYAGMIEPRFKATFCFAAELSLAIGNPKRALKNLYDIMQRDTPDASILKMTAQSYQALDNPLKAREYFLLARNLDPLDDEIYYQIGRLYLQGGKANIAARYFERAINLDDRNEDYMLALADAWLKDGRIEEAEACFMRATEIAPEMPTCWLRFAEYKWHNGDLSGTLEIIEESMEYTWGAELYYLKAAVNFTLGERRQALLDMEEALAEGFDERNALFKYLPDYKKDKDVKAIIRYFELELAG